MRAMERLRQAYLQERQPFVAACYRELLAREPDPQGMEHHLRLLAAGTPKVAIMTGLLQSEEAARLYRSGPAPGSGKRRRSTADILRSVFAGSDERCVRGLYEELLCRSPDYPSFGHHVRHLKQGAARTEIAASLLRSAEAAELLKASTNIPIAQKILFDFADRTFMPDLCG